MPRRPHQILNPDGPARTDASRVPGGIVVVGGTVLDVIFRHVPRLPVWPRHTESTPRNLTRVDTPPIVTLGGNGANAAYVAATCGADVTLCTSLGDDPPGHLVRGWLEGAGCRVVASPPCAATAMNVVAANARLERAMLFHPGTPVDVRGVTSVLEQAPRWLLICGWPHPALTRIEKTFRIARTRGTATALDTGPILDRPWTLTALRSVLRELDLLLTNEYELRRITAAPSLDAALWRTRAVFRGEIVIKRGRDGAWWSPADGRDLVAVRAPRVRALNTVGAGDSFNGALLASLARCEAIPAAIRAACEVAASVVASSRGVLGVKSARPKSLPRKSA